ncbi:NHLP leader peptide family RiPP precursor [Paenibacillus sediminis]|uniref:NHLP leader peptide family natural product n=1 Tax=Paenibacillus sediminis TaxID=664909 RepID=A0ABS4H4Q1_9BACL|nr:NHLP leader peptide family RiPP precursor [Paenibacillus sediminis]MBP1937347.1 hypothetical protein [Paenibacillus sediminis]
MSAEAILRKQIIEKAWEDPSFKQELLSNPKAAIQEAFNVTLPDQLDIKTVEEKNNQLYLIIPQAPTEVIKKSDVTLLSYW